MRNIKRNVKALRGIGFGIDIANAVLSGLVVIFSILIIVNINGFAKLFPILFLFAFLMNLLLGFKRSLREEKLRAVIQYVVAGVLLIISLSGFIGLWR